MQADAYAGFNRVYGASRKPGPITEVACWSHARHNFFDLDRLAKAPIAIEAVKRIDELFAIEREINGLSSQERLCVRNEHSRPLMVALEVWLREQRAKLSGQSSVSKSHRLLPDPMGRPDALPQRRAAVHVQQCRRAGDPANCCRSP